MTGKDLNLKGQGKIVSTVVSDEKKSQSTAINVTNGTVNIYDGIEVDGGNGCDGNYAVKIVKGTVNIHGGYFHSAPKKEGDVTEVIYLASAYAYSSKCYLNIYGGVFESGGDPKYLIIVRTIIGPSAISRLWEASLLASIRLTILLKGLIPIGFRMVMFPLKPPITARPLGKSRRNNTTFIVYIIKSKG